MSVISRTVNAPKQYCDRRFLNLVEHSLIRLCSLAFGSFTITVLSAFLTIVGCMRPHPEPRNTFHIGQTFRDCAECPEMVVLPTGSFTMGSPGGWTQHSVAIAYSFAVGKYPVTVGEYEQFVASSGYSGSFAWRNPGWQQTSRHPVVSVSWDDAQAYVKWINKKTHHQYRLLSEAEYEYAERAGTTTAYWWGDDAGQLCSNVNGLHCHHGTVTVGRYPPNKFHLYDMTGNVWEWTEDCYHDTYDGAPDDGSAWTTGNCARARLFGAVGAVARVLRGGSWQCIHVWAWSLPAAWGSTRVSPVQCSTPTSVSG
jgi:formylglycine-generating enzyme required for sulfatase activity